SLGGETCPLSGRGGRVRRRGGIRLVGVWTLVVALGCELSGWEIFREVRSNACWFIQHLLGCSAVPGRRPMGLPLPCLCWGRVARVLCRWRWVLRLVSARRVLLHDAGLLDH